MPGEAAWPRRDPSLRRHPKPAANCRAQSHIGLTRLEPNPTRPKVPAVVEGSSAAPPPPPESAAAVPPAVGPPADLRSGPLPPPGPVADRYSWSSQLSVTAPITEVRLPPDPGLDGPFRAHSLPEAALRALPPRVALDSVTSARATRLHVVEGSRVRGGMERQLSCGPTSAVCHSLLWRSVRHRTVWRDPPTAARVSLERGPDSKNHLTLGNVEMGVLRGAHSGQRNVSRERTFEPESTSGVDFLSLQVRVGAR